MSFSKLFISFIIFCLFASAACRSETNNDKISNLNSAPKNVNLPKGAFAVEFKAEPAEVKAGEKAKLIFTVKNDIGAIVKDLPIAHGKPMHLLIVSEDLEEFYHEHPEAQADGTYAAAFTFPNGGSYKFYTDFTPSGTEQVVKDFSLNISGNPRSAKELKADENFEKTVQNLRVVMKPDGNLVSGKQMLMNFQVFDAQTSQPVTDLENYLGAKAHFVVISRDLKDFVHAHPMSKDNVKSAEHNHDEANEKMAGAESMSIVSAHITFPKPSIYRVWAQFQRGGTVTTVPFTIDIKQGEAEKRLETAEIPKGAFKIVVSRDGFTPEEVTFQKGQPLKLAFFRADTENCAEEVIFKELNIKKKLPLGEIVLIDIPTAKAGEINFACGMNMYKGKIVIE